MNLLKTGNPFAPIVLLLEEDLAGFWDSFLRATLEDDLYDCLLFYYFGCCDFVRCAK